MIGGSRAFVWLVGLVPFVASFDSIGVGGEDAFEDGKQGVDDGVARGPLDALCFNAFSHQLAND